VLVPELDRRMDALDFSGGLEAIWRLVGRANKYVEETRPWELRKDPARADELGLVLYNLVETLRVLTYLVSPFIPDAADRLAQQLRVPRPMAVGKDGYALAEVLLWGGLTAGHQTEVGEVLFPRLERVVSES
jgi:methionyl-tRNA synthetase